MTNDATLEIKPSANFTWIMHETLYSTAISFKAKGLWCYINSKPNGWQFSSDRIAKEAKEDKKAIRSGLKELVDSGLLKWQKLPDGHIVYELLDTKPDPKCQNGTVPKRHRAETAPISKKDIKVRKNNKVKGSNDEPAEQAAEFSTEFCTGQEEQGNSQINAMFAYWEQTKGYPIKSNVASNRRACYNLLRRKDIGEERLKTIIADLVDGKMYPPNCADFVELQGKWCKVEDWQNRLKPKKKTIADLYKPAHEVVKVAQETDEEHAKTSAAMAEFKASFFGR